MLLNTDVNNKFMSQQELSIPAFVISSELLNNNNFMSEEYIEDDIIEEDMVEIKEEKSTINYNFITSFEEYDRFYNDNMDFCDALYNHIKKNLYQNVRFTEIPFDISKYSNATWILETDFGTNIQLDEDDSVLKTAEVMSLYDEVSLIMNESLVDIKDLDTNFKQYIKVTSEFVGYILNKMLENNSWKFNPLDKILWIYLMIACRHEPRAIKYLVNSPYWNKKILTQPDIYGMYPLLIACRTGNLEVISNLNLNGDITCNMFKYEYNTVPIVMYTIYHTNIFKYMLNNVKDFNSVIFEKYGQNITPFLFACQTNVEVAEIILNNPQMTQDYFDTIHDNINSIAMASFYSPYLLEKILESKFCNQELIDKIYGKYGNILNIVSRFNPDHIDIILNSKFMNKNLMTGVVTILYDFKLTVLTDVKTIDHYNKIIQSRYFDPTILQICQPNGESILFQIIRNSKDVFYRFLDSIYCTTELITMKTTHNENILHFVATTDVEIFNKFLERPDIIDDNILFDQDTIMNRIPFMVALANPDNKDKISPDIIKYITPKLLDVCDIYGFNLFCYFCKFAPLLAIELIDKYKMQFDMLVRTTDRKLPMLSNILCVSSDERVITSIINSDIIKKIPQDIIDNIMTSVDSITKNSIYMEMVRANPNLAHLLINSKMVTDSSLLLVNAYGDNILTYSFIYGTYNIIKALLSTKVANILLNIRDKENNPPIILACKWGYETTFLLINSELFDSKTLMDKNNYNQCCIHEACSQQDIKLVKLLLDHPAVTESVFLDNNNINSSLCIQALHSTIEIAEYVLNHKLCSTEVIKCSLETWFRENPETIIPKLNVILNSKYFSKDILMCKNLSGQNIISNCLIRDIESAKLILQSNHISKELLRDIDNNGRNVLHYTPCVDTALLVIDSNVFDDVILKQVDSNGLTPIQYQLVCKRKDVASIIMGSEYCTAEILKIRSIEGKNVINNMFSYNISTEILQQPILSSEDLLDVDNNGRSCLHDLMSHIPNINRIDKLTELFKSDKCSSQLLELSDKDGNTFLMSIYINELILIEVLNSVHTTLTMINKVNNKHENIITYFSDKSPILIQIILSHEKATRKLLTPDDKLCNPFVTALEQPNNCYLDIMQSQYFDVDCINRENYTGFTPLLICVKYKLKERLNQLLESKYDLTSSFNRKYNIYNNMNIIGISALYDNTIFKIILESKYTKYSMLTDKYNKMNYTTVSAIFSTTIDNVKLLVESKYWTDEIMYNTDIDNDHLLMRTYEQPDIIKYLLNSDKCTTQFVMMKNKLNMLCSHTFALHSSPEAIKNLFESKHGNNKELYSHQDVFGRTCLHILAQNMPETILEFIQNPVCTSDLFLIRDNKNKNVLMILIETNPDVAITLLESKFLTSDILSQIDIEGCSSLFYAVKHSLLVLEKILDSEYLTYDIFNHRNNNYESIIMYASRYNNDVFKILLNSKYFTQDLLTSTHTDYGSALTIASRYQPPIVKQILLIPDLSLEVTKFLENDKNFIEIACIYNADSIRYALDSNYDLSYYINDKSNAILYASKYQPDAVKYILESNYVSSDIFLLRNEERNCVDEALDFQPKALLYMINSKLATDTLLNQPDQIGYRLINKLKMIYPTLTSIHDIKNNKLTEYINIINHGEYDSTTCNICCAYKIKVVFACSHTSCIGCAFKLKNCPLCRDVIDKRIVIYE